MFIEKIFLQVIDVAQKRIFYYNPISSAEPARHTSVKEAMW